MTLKEQFEVAQKLIEELHEKCPDIRIIYNCEFDAKGTVLFSVKDNEPADESIITKIDGLLLIDSKFIDKSGDSELIKLNSINSEDRDNPVSENIKTMFVRPFFIGKTSKNQINSTFLN